MMLRRLRLNEKKRLLKIRRTLNALKPRFTRMNTLNLKRVPDSWRNPRGLDNKIRIGRKGYPQRVKIGYRGPRAVRGLHPRGLIDVLVDSVKDLDGLTLSQHCVRIAHTVGARKRAEIVKKATRLGLTIINP